MPPIAQPTTGLDSIPAAPVILVDTSGNYVAPAGIGGAVNPTSGALIAVTGNAALTASTDMSYTFASQVKHVLVQNNTPTAAFVEFDAAATPGSLEVYSGGQLFLFDIPCTVVHLFSTAASNVNGTASGNIVVKGWA